MPYQLLSMNVASIGHDPYLKLLNKLCSSTLRSSIALCYVFNFTFAKWIHNPRQCNKDSVVITLFCNSVCIANSNQKTRTKRKAAWFKLSPQFHLIAKHSSLFLASIFYAKCSVVFVACFSSRSHFHVHMVCEAHTSFLYCSGSLVLNFW